MCAQYVRTYTDLTVEITILLSLNSRNFQIPYTQSFSINRVYAEWGKDINKEQMEGIVLEKLQMIENDPESNNDKIRELWDDIQILAFMEDSEDKVKAKHANLLLKNHIGDQKSNTLLKIIDKIANNEIQPQPKTVKMPPSWINEKKERKFDAAILTPPDYNI